MLLMLNLWKKCISISTGIMFWCIKLHSVPGLFISSLPGITNFKYKFQPLLTHNKRCSCISCFCYCRTHTTFSLKTMVPFSTGHYFVYVVLSSWYKLLCLSVSAFVCISTRPNLLSGVVKRTMNVASASSLVTSGSFTFLTSFQTSPRKLVSTIRY